MNRKTLKLLLLAALLPAFVLLVPATASAEGTWLPLNGFPAPDGIGTMLLLSDGTVMAIGGSANATVNWYRLTPDATGGYTNATWTSLPSMTYSRYAFGSDVLPDGRVFVVGGEYGNGTTNGEVYDPVANSWSVIPAPNGLIDETPAFGSEGENDYGFADCPTIMTANGKVLISPVFPGHASTCALFDPVSNTLQQGPGYKAQPNNEDEAGYVKLPDDSIMVIDSYLTMGQGYETTERYIPSQNQWFLDDILGEILYDQYGHELGPGFLLPNTNIFWIGSAPLTAIYTPGDNSSGPVNGAWNSGPPIPNNLGAPDAPAAMMANGKVLCALSPTPDASGDSGIFTSPTYFYEFNYADTTMSPYGSFTQIHAPNYPEGNNYTFGSPTYVERMLDLPDGTVLFSFSANQLWCYVPDGSPLSAGQPSIISVSANHDGSFLLTGTGLNGISQGANYGDDAQMDSNYPLVKVLDGHGHVYYARTFNWSSTSVMTGNKPVSTDFTWPTTLPGGGVYWIEAVANGNSSPSFTMDGPVWVDFNYPPSSPQLGNFASPFSTIAQGITTVASGGTIFIKPGTSSETPTIRTPMTLMAVGGSVTIGQ